MTDDPEQKEPSSHEDKILGELRQRYKYASDQWKDIRDEAKKDMQFIMGNPWDDEDVRARKQANRPLISCDELNQYINQACNNVRQNPRGIKIDPAGNQATDKTAEIHENLVRGIEYKSNAQRSAYIPAFECALERSYGAFRITRQYVSDESFDQEIRIKGILNPDAVLFDPDCKEADWSDADYVFVVDVLTKDEFKRRYPKAKIQSFSDDHMRLAPEWVRDDHIVIAEYWRAESKVRTLLLLDGKAGPTPVYEDELPEGEKPKVLKKRQVITREIVEYITNGVEILEEIPQPGIFIPIVAVIGKERYVDEGSGAKRHLISAVRLARDPQKAFAYLCTKEMELTKLVPLAPYVGYKGQFESDKDAWDSNTDVPHPYLQADAVVDQVTGQILPKPERQILTTDYSGIEMAKDSMRRSIMSAMGITPLPTAAQRNNEKSGVALEKIQNQESVGTFHFTDNLDRALTLAGRIIESWLPVVYDTEREAAIRKADESHAVVKLNTAEPYQDEKGQTHHYPLVDSDGAPIGAHDVAVSVGRSTASQHEENAEFLNTLVQGLPNMPIPPPAGAKLIALAIRMRNLGPLAEEMANIISPEENPNLPPEAQNAIAQLQAQLQLAQQELQKLQMEKLGKVTEMQGKMALAQQEGQVRMAEADKDRETKMAVAEITALKERVGAAEDMMKQLHQQAHDLAMSMQQQKHEKDMADKQAAAASMQSAQDAQHAAQQPAGQ